MGTELVFTRPAEITGIMSGIVTLPTDFDKEKESLPVIVFLHGAGERGKPEMPGMNRLKIHGIPKLFCADNDYHGLRVITLTPQCPENMTWINLTYPLKKWIEEAVAEFNGDTNRISVTGISMGGFGTWDMITSFPDYFSCAAPICGGGAAFRTRSLSGVKMRVYHGLDDEAVPFTCSLEMTMAARKNGADITLTAYDKVGHGSWVPAYEQTDLVEWLAEQTR